ncbi:unknown [Bacteroides sp. CAG:144]|nr:unknown [Bacteroides sp. CAG:144]
MAVEQIGFPTECLAPNMRSVTFLDVGDAVVTQSDAVGRIRFIVFESVAVEFFQPVPCRQPNVSFVILYNTLYGILR